jgi:DNA polymerase-1
LMGFDYSQVELRIAAFLSCDEKLINAFKKGVDIHTAVAAEVFAVKPEDVEKEQRRQAKVINFGILYGMGVTALQKNLGTDRKTAQEFYNKYFESYEGVAKYVDKIKKETKLKGYTETLFGRRRYFEGFNSPLPFIRAQAERMAINAPIQGTQADLIKLAMVKIDNFLKKESFDKKVRLILQIHDEVIYEVDEKIAKENKIQERIIEIMENVLTPEKTSGIPIIAECESGLNWGELK